MKYSEILKIKNNLKTQNDFLDYYNSTLKNLQENASLNAYLQLIENYKYAQNSNSVLANVLYAVKDNINVLDTTTTGGSLFFKDYKSPYSASVIENLNAVGAIPICKANLDEFGLGGTGLFSAYGFVKNPYDETRISAGSSSGSAVLVAKKLVAFSLGTDTGDSIRMPSSYLGIYGFKPSYGVVSRFGVFPYSPSLDHVGVMANSVYDIALVMDVIAKHDPQDFTSQNVNFDFVNKINEQNDFLITSFNNITELLGESEKDLFNKTLSKIQQHFKFETETYPLELIKLIPRVYEILSYSEAVSCYQNITGIPFGDKQDGKGFEQKTINTRTKNFGKELKRRFVLGAYCTLANNYEEVFLKCKKIRRLIVEKVEKTLEQYDFIIMPGSASIAPKVNDVLEGKVVPNDVDNYLQIANFGGFPSITIPMGKIDNMPIGINIMGKINSDEKLLAIANKIDRIIKGEYDEK